MANDLVRRDIADLDACQVSAIVALARGATVATAASEAGAERAAILRWMADDPRFIAGLNLAKRHASEALRAEVRVGAAEAVATLRELMRGRHGPTTRLKAAVALLKAGGGDQSESVGSTDPDVIAADQRRDALRKRFALALEK